MTNETNAMSTPPTHDHRHRVLVADELSSEGLELLRNHPDLVVEVRTGLDEAALIAAVKHVDAIIVRSSTRISADVVAAASRLRVIGRAGIRVDNVDVEASTARGILVMNCPDANADTTAEHTLALLFALARHVPQSDRALRAGAKFSKSRFLGIELQGKVLGILGGGNIGQRVARRARAIGMEPIVYDPFLAPDALKDSGATVLPLEVVLAKADFLTIHVPLLENTHHFVDAAMFARMKDGVRIIHCARGGILDETALLAALESKKVAGAALDVFEVEPPSPDHPLLQREDVVATPHLGAATHEAQARAALEICRQVIGYLVDGELRNAVNLPRLTTTAFRAVAPWLDLGRRLGRLLSGLSEPKVERIEVTFHGRLAQLDTATVTRAALAGFVATRSRRPVNEVNAFAAAAELEIAVGERHSEHMRDFPNLLAIHSHSGARRVSVAGALFGHRQPRIVRIGEHPLEALAEGILLVIRNEDRPGVVGRVGTLLGDAHVNIRAMHLSPPRSKDGDALAVLNVEPGVPQGALDAIVALPEVREAVLIDLGPS